MSESDTKAGGEHPSSCAPLSVVVASTRSGIEAAAWLEKLAAQDTEQKVEIIVAHAGADWPTANSQRNVTLLPFPAQATLPTLWGAALAQASGEIIAVTEADCTLAPDWIASLRKAHESPALVMGGAVEVIPCQSLLDWAAFFCDYGQFLLPLQEAAATELPGNNLSFKRQALEIGADFITPEFWKTYWCRQLQAAGIVLRATPSVVIYYQKSYRLGPFLWRRFHQGRCFAGLRIVRLSVAFRLLYALGAWLLPFLFLARIVTSIVPKKRYRREFILSLPFAVLAVVSWSVGEFWGYLTGAGTSCRHIR